LKCSVATKPQFDRDEHVSKQVEGFPRAINMGGSPYLFCDSMPAKQKPAIPIPIGVLVLYDQCRARTPLLPKEGTGLVAKRYPEFKRALATGEAA